MPKATVSGIAATIGEQLERVRTEKKEAVGDLIMGYFNAALHAMISQAEVFGDPAYCRTQDADKLAIAHGVIGDKLAGIATTAQALGLLGHEVESFEALPDSGDRTADGQITVDYSDGSEARQDLPRSSRSLR